MTDLFGKPEEDTGWLPPLFDKFWARYPRRVSKGAARKAFDKAMKGMARPEAEKLLEDMLAAVDAQIRHRRVMEREGNFLPDWKHPTTWLNGNCWLDELDYSPSDRKQPVAATCKTEGCTRQVHGPKFAHCTEHLPLDGWREHALRERYREAGLGRRKDETKQDHGKRLRQEAREAFAKMRQRVGG